MLGKPLFIWRQNRFIKVYEKGKIFNNRSQIVGLMPNVIMLMCQQQSKAPVTTNVPTETGWLDLNDLDEAKNGSCVYSHMNSDFFYLT